MPPEKKKLTEDSALSTESVKTSNDEKDNMATIPPGLEGLLDRRLKEQTEQICDLFKKFTVTTKSELEAIKKSQDFLANKFDDLAVLTNKLQDKNKELRKTNTELQDRCAALEKQCIREHKIYNTASSKTRPDFQLKNEY